MDREMSKMSLRSDDDQEDVRASSANSLQRSLETVNRALLSSVNVRQKSTAANTSSKGFSSAYSRKKDREGVSIQDQARQLTKILINTGDKYVRQKHLEYMRSTKMKQNNEKDLKSIILEEDVFNRLYQMSEKKKQPKILSNPST